MLWGQKECRLLEKAKQYASQVILCRFTKAGMIGTVSSNRMHILGVELGNSESLAVERDWESN